MPRHPTSFSTTAEWYAQFSDAGLLEKRSLVLSQYAGELSKRGFPVIFSFRHLCLLLGVTPKYLASVVFSAESHYRSFLIPKRSGGQREIVAPYPMLLQCLRWICKHILGTKKINRAAHGYVTGRSIISNASQHLGKTQLLKIDLKDFFPSIPIQRVIGYFKSIGYAPEVAYFLAKLCCLNEALPQGAATSPMLSNILMHHVDRRLAGLSKKHEVTYSRYADDLAFSGEAISSQFIADVERIVVETGFQINPEKKLLITAGRRKIIAGIDITSGKARVPREFRRQTRLEAHFAIKFGAVKYILQRRHTPNALLELAGKLAYWRQVEPDNEFVVMAFEKVREMCRNQ